MTNKHIELPALSDEQIKQVLTNSDLWDMHQHMGWYSAPEKNFKTYGVMLARDLISARDAQWNEATEAQQRVLAEQARVVGEPVAYLWQHSETGRTRVILPDEIVANENTWNIIGPLVLTSGRNEPVAVLRYERGTPGKENDMPRVVSCDWLPDGEYKVFAASPAPQEAQVIGRVTHRMDGAVIADLNSVGRALPDNAPLFATTVAQPATEQAEAPKPGKLKVTLQDTEGDRYRRMFEAACVALGQISEELGLDPEDGGADPIISAIAALRASSPAERLPLTEKQIHDWWARTNGLEDLDLCKQDDFRTMVRAVEDRLGIVTKESK